MEMRIVCDRPVLSTFAFGDNSELEEVKLQFRIQWVIIIKTRFISVGRNKNRNRRPRALGRNLGHPMDQHFILLHKGYQASLWCCDNMVSPS